MLYDQHGRMLPEIASQKPPAAGRWTIPEIADRAYDDVSRGFTPLDVDSIITRANSGDAADQAALGMELLEKSDAVIAAFSVRSRAVSGLQYHIEPGDKTPAAKRAAEAFDQALDASGETDEMADGAPVDGFPALVSDMLQAIIVGYSLNEIIWGPGGTLTGFTSIDSRLLDFTRGFLPRIRHTGGYAELVPDKYVWMATREHGPDPVRGGLIRPLAWLHCFLRMNRVDLMAFIERYGMPFLVAKISDDSFQNELYQMLKLISSFGPNGGGVVRQGTEVQMIQAANNTGDIYFKAIEHFERAIQRLILGQTATSGDGGGLSKDNAQDKVRQDILEADALMLSNVINRKLAAPWCRFNFGANVAPPRLVYDVSPPEDKLSLGELVAKLSGAGYICDPAEIGERLGLKLSRVEVQTPPPGADGSTGGEAPAGEAPAVDADTLNLKQKYDAMGVAIRAGLLTATPEIEEQTRRELGLPPISEAVKKAWDATGGIRQPITLKTAESAAVNDALKVDDQPDQSAPASQTSLEREPPEQLPGPTVGKPPEAVLEKWLAPLAKGVAGVVEASDEDFDAALLELLDNPPLDTEMGADLVEAETVKGFAAGTVAGYKGGKT